MESGVVKILTILIVVAVSSMANAQLDTVNIIQVNEDHSYGYDIGVLVSENIKVVDTPSVVKESYFTTVTMANEQRLNQSFIDTPSLPGVTHDVLLLLGTALIALLCIGRKREVFTES